MGKNKQNQILQDNHNIRRQSKVVRYLTSKSYVNFKKDAKKA